MERSRLPGTLKFLGEPAEKVCGSKPIHAAKGYYDGVDAFIAYHPWPLNSVPWETHFGAYWSAVFTFECLAPETWIDRTLMPAGSGSHGIARCPGALDALCLMYTMTKYTWHAPTVRLLTARPVLQSPDPRHAAPAWTYNALGGYAPAIDPGMFVAAKTIAATLLDLLTRSEALARCQAEFVERTGVGVGGTRWIGPLLPADFAPPVDLPWPQYVTTVRGEEWWMPAPTAGAAEPL